MVEEERLMIWDAEASAMSLSAVRRAFAVKTSNILTKKY